MGYRALNPTKDTQLQASLVALPVSDAGFLRVEGPQALAFPQDLGPHPDYQVEWWYYTGNLDSADGQHFGYQLTFFRRSIAPPADVAARPSTWATNQVYMAHFALTDVAGQRFLSFERLQRGAAGLAGAESEPQFRVWLEDWSIQLEMDGKFQLHAAQDGLALDLELQDAKGITLEGDRGFSQKGSEPGNASTYFSQTRLETRGTVQIQGQTDRVNGLSWMDHEFSTSALGHGQVGWDWFALQSSDGSELMIYNLRQGQAGQDPFSGGTYIAVDGKTQTLKPVDFKIRNLASWMSPHTGANYPSRWQVDIPVLGLSLDVEPYLADQENRLSFTYWEGAVHFKGQHDGVAVTGVGYVELTGYAGSLHGKVY